MNRLDFIAVIAPIAVQLRREGSPLLPSVRIAQTMLETGCVLHSWNNLVGYKVGSGQPNAFWKGRSVSTQTWEVYDGVRVDGVQANWRAYDAIEDCYKDQDLLFHWSRYDRVRAATCPQEQTAALYQCGYATDPAYALKLNSFIAGFELEQYDKEAEQPMLDKDIANNIIDSYLVPAWNTHNESYEAALAAGDVKKAKEAKSVRDWQNMLANELRRASGLTEE